MSKIETAFARLDRALDALQNRMESLEEKRTEEADFTSERDALTAKINRLEARSHEEAQLRGEAADAVRAALMDLRAMAGQAGLAGSA
ncbi:MAG: hypothetical protein AAF415_06935 [Pseudomonadota bacterium]